MTTNTKVNNDHSRSPPIVFAMIEWFWSPKEGWHALRAEAAEAAPEEPMMVAGLDEMRWLRVLEESIAAGEEEIVPPDLELVERIWQKQFRHSKRIYRHFSHYIDQALTTLN